MQPDGNLIVYTNSIKNTGDYDGANLRLTGNIGASGKESYIGAFGTSYINNTGEYIGKILRIGSITSDNWNINQNGTIQTNGNISTKRGSDGSSTAIYTGTLHTNRSSY